MRRGDDMVSRSGWRTRHLERVLSSGSMIDEDTNVMPPLIRLRIDTYEAVSLYSIIAVIVIYRLPPGPRRSTG